MAKSGTRTMSDQHKAALAEGRSEGRAVKAYLEALEQNRPRRGRKRTPDSVKKRLAAIDAQLPEASALARLQLLAAQGHLVRRLARARRVGRHPQEGRRLPLIRG
jgi:hypothetical protein